MINKKLGEFQMKELEAKKYPLYEERTDGNYYDIKLKRDGNKTCSIFFGGNLDLYFSLENFDNDSTFIIGKDNYEIYTLFDKLYHDVLNANIYEKLTDREINFIILISELEEEDYRQKIAEELKRREKYQNDLRKSIQYKSLVQDGVITWRSDEYFDEIAPFVKIKKQEDTYVLEFGKPNIPDEYKNDADLILMDSRKITVRFRNSGSKYDPFNIIFMKLYQELCALDYEYHQIHIEEYLLDHKIKRRILKKESPK